MGYGRPVSQGLRSKAEDKMRSLDNLLARTGIHAVIIFTLIVGMGWSGTAWGQKRKVIRLEAIKVEGRIQKPQAFYILQRSTLNYQGLELKQSFIPKILKSVNDKPF
mgnify:CR=1 FL=1